MSTGHLSSKRKKTFNIYEVLHDLRKHKLVALYANRYDSEEFLAVYVLSFSKEYILFQSVSPYGEQDGYGVIQINKIYRIEKSSMYIKCLEKLCVNCKDNNNLKIDVDNNCITSLLTYAWNNNKIIRIGLIDDYNNWIVGYIIGLENNVIKLKCIDEYGEFDGYCIIHSSDCVELSCDGLSENKIQKLFEMRVVVKNEDI